MADVPRWLTQGFARGVDERQPIRPPQPAYPGANPYCLLAASDERRRPCTGRLERFHWINRQRAANALSALLPTSAIDLRRIAPPPEDCHVFDADQVADLIQLVEWDPRNSDLGCEGHHRRFDNHLTPSLTVRYERLPSHLIQFAFDWGIEAQLDRFPSEI